MAMCFYGDDIKFTFISKQINSSVTFNCFTHLKALSHRLQWRIVSWFRNMCLFKAASFRTIFLQIEHFRVSDECPWYPIIWLRRHAFRFNLINMHIVGINFFFLYFNFRFFTKHRKYRIEPCSEVFLNVHIWRDYGMSVYFWIDVHTPRTHTLALIHELVVCGPIVVYPTGSWKQSKMSFWCSARA